MTWYWQMWRKQLWEIHLLVFATVAILASRLIFDGAPTSLLGGLLIASIGRVASDNAAERGAIAKYARTGAMLTFPY